jgi:histone H3/H4
MSESNNNDDDDNEAKELRAALQVAVARICTQSVDNSVPDDATMTASAIRSLTELTYLYATTTLANDLVAFSRHANRRTIQPEDVLLVVRENPNQWRTSSLSKWDRRDVLLLEEDSQKKSGKMITNSGKTKGSARRSQKELHRRLLMGTDSEADDDSNDDDDDSDVVISKRMKESKRFLSKQVMLDSDSSDKETFSSVAKVGQGSKKTKTSIEDDDKLFFSSSEDNC